MERLSFQIESSGMELIFLCGFVLLLIGLIRTWSIQKEIARREHLKQKKLSAIAEPSLPAITLEAVVFEEESPRYNYIDPGYQKFVDEIWAQSVADLPEKVIQIGSRSFTMKSLTPSGRGYPYLNVIDEYGVRKTFAADARNTIFLGGTRIAHSAFEAILAGVSPEEAFLPDRHPASLDEALLKDRLQVDGPRYILKYHNSRGEVGWRVISRPRRLKDVLTARCHYRRGAQRHFHWDGVEELLSLPDRRAIDLGKYRQGAQLKDCFLS